MAPIRLFKALVSLGCLLTPNFCPQMELDFTSQDGQLQLNGHRFHLKGTNWFGFETEIKVLHGIWSFKLESFLDFLKDHGFNALRVPFAAELAFELDTYVPDPVNTTTNPNLASRSSGFILDYLVQESAKRGILIMLDMHCLTAKAGITELWHMDGFPEERLVQAWSIMARRYLNSWNVFAYDLKNEPHDSASWGDNNLRTDWRLAAERLGNELLAINPRALIFVEGTSGTQVPFTSSEAAFWGGSFSSARETPIRLNNFKKLVYSPHVYGPGVYMQEYFKSQNFPNNMPGIWTQQWGHLVHEPKHGPAVVVGEWGGIFKEGSLEQTWAEAIVDYIQKIGATDQFFWCLNPNSGDTGGLLEDDWQTPATYKLMLIHRLCPSPSRILVDSSGQPVEVSYDGSGHPAPAPSYEPLQNTCRVSDQPGPGTRPVNQQNSAGNDGHGSGRPEENLANLPSLLDIVVDTSAIEGLTGSAKVVKTWTDGTKGQQFQIECNVQSQQQISDLILEVSPSTGVAQVWNLTSIREGSLYSLPDWSIKYGGLKPNQPLSWGGIISDPNTRLRYLPRLDGRDRQEL